MKKAAFLAALVLVLWSPTSGLARCPQSRGQTVYVPATYNDFTSLINLEEKSYTRLCIFNIDRQKSLTLTSVKFYSPLGVLVKEYLGAPVNIAPLSSVNFLTDSSFLGVPHYDPNGGRPCFLIKWRASGMVCAPLLESRKFVLRNYAAGVWGMEAMDFVGGIVLEESPPPLPFLYLLLEGVDLH